MYNPIEFNDLVGETLTHIDIDPENNEILLTTKSDKKIIIKHDQNCCESVKLVYYSPNWKKLIGKVIVDTSENAVSSMNGYDSRTDTDLTFSVDDATVITKWVGESNGYYSETVDIHDITEYFQKSS